MLSSIAYISLSGETAQARDSKRQADLKTLENAISMSNAQNKTITYLNPITTGAAKITTTNGDIHTLRNAQAFEVSSGFINSTVLATIPRDPKGAPYLAAFINQNQFQLGGVLENPTTKVSTTTLMGSFKENAIVDNILTEIDNDDTFIPVGNAGQFIRGDVIQIDSEQMLITDISLLDEPPSADDQSALIVTRGHNNTTATVHSNRSYIQLSTFADNASSLFCLGDLAPPLAKTVADVSLLTPNFPLNWAVTPASVTLDDTYTCSVSGDISNGGSVLLYEVAL